jgi:polyisoprenoid-binding protein YceI
MSETGTTTTTSTIPGLVAGTYAVDTAHSEIGFTVRHLMTKVRGTFKEFAGEIVVTDTLGSPPQPSPSSSPRWTLATSSVTATCARVTSSTWRRAPR